MASEHTFCFLPPTNIFNDFRLKFFTVCVIFLLNTDSISCRLNPSPEHELFSDQLCPDPLVSNVSSSSGEPNNTVLIKLAEDYPRYQGFLPCSFEVDVPNGNNGSFVNITAVTLNTDSWNFSNAKQCSSYFRFKHKDEYGDGFEVECHAWKRAIIGESVALYAHPMIMDYRWEPKRLSFAIFHSSFGHDFHDVHDSLTELSYFQIHFSADAGNNRSLCRVQQYKLDTAKQGCNDKYELQTICGEYDCDKSHIIDQKYKKKVSTDHIPDVTDIPPPGLDYEDDDDYIHNRILTIGTLLAVAITPVICSIGIFLVYKYYINPRVEIRYTRSNATGENREVVVQPSTPSFPQSSIELQETWQLSTPDPRSTSPLNLDVEMGIPNATSGCTARVDSSPVDKPLSESSAKPDLPPPYEDLLPNYGDAKISGVQKWLQADKNQLAS